MHVSNTTRIARSTNKHCTGRYIRCRYSVGGAASAHASQARNREKRGMRSWTARAPPLRSSSDMTATQLYARGQLTDDVRGRKDAPRAKAKQAQANPILSSVSSALAVASGEEPPTGSGDGDGDGDVRVTVTVSCSCTEQRQRYRLELSHARETSDTFLPEIPCRVQISRATLLACLIILVTLIS
jgi:hypothetical protein